MFDKRQRVRIEDFLKRQLFGNHYDKPIAKISIRHISGASKMGSEIHCIKFKTEPQYEDMEAAISEIESVVFSDAEALEGLQKYGILASVDGEQARSRLVLSIQSSSLEDDGVSTEPATQTGLLTQLMRHNEAIQRTSIMGIQNMMGHMARSIQTLSDQVETLTKKNFDTLELYEEMATQRHIRELETDREKFAMESKREMINEVKPYIAVIANKIAGKKILPEKKDPKVEMVKAFVKSIQNEQLDQIMELLTAEQITEFTKVLEAVAENGNGVIDVPSFHGFIKSLSQEQVMSMRGFLSQSQQITIYQIFQSMEQETQASS